MVVMALGEALCTCVTTCDRVFRTGAYSKAVYGREKIYTSENEHLFE